jgi:hypothetical protein
MLLCHSRVTARLQSIEESPGREHVAAIYKRLTEDGRVRQGRGIVHVEEIRGPCPSTEDDVFVVGLKRLVQSGGFMRVRGKVLLVLSLLVATPTVLTAQTRAVLDLTDAGGSRQISPGKVEVTLINMVPGGPYTISTKVQTVPIPPFSVTSLGITPVAAAAAAAAAANPCDQASNTITTDLSTAKSEQDVKKAIDTLRSSANFKSCTDSTKIQGIETLIKDDTTKVLSGSFTVNQGQELVVEIKRSDPTASDPKHEKSWAFVLTTGAKGAWLIHYGFSFLKDQDQTYFSKADDPTTDASGKPNPTTYHITRKSEHSGLKTEPSVILSYVPARFQNNNFIPAVTAGLGVDLNNPFVFFGGSFLVGDNVNIFIGAAVHREKRLNGKYHEGDPVKENLSEDQLTDNVPKPALVFGVGFRFDTNPFKKSSGSGNSGTGSGSSTGSGSGSGN